MDPCSEDYAATVEILRMRLCAFIGRKSMAPPLEIHVNGADDDEVIHASLREDGRLVDLMSYPEQTVSARFPLTATVTDAKGNALEITVTPDTLVQ